MTPSRPPGRLLALGDSITVGGPGADVAGVPCRSWARWLAEALGLRPVLLAEPGLTAPGLASRWLPRIPDGRFAVGALYIGVNDVRSPAWEPEPYAAALARCAGAVAAVSDRTVLLTAPLDLGRPRAGGKVADLNALVRAEAARVGAIVCELTDMCGRRLVDPDAVHPTALGQRWIAGRASAALGGPAIPVATLGRTAAVRDDVLRHGRLVARERIRRLRER